MTMQPGPRPSETPNVEAITDWLVSCVTDYREVDPSSVDPQAQLTDLGLDSVYALTLCGDIEDRWGLETDPTVAWDHSTIAALATHLHERLAAGGDPG